MTSDDVGNGQRGPHQTMTVTRPLQDKWPTDNNNNNNNNNNVGDGRRGRTNSLWTTMTMSSPPELVYVHDVLDIFNITCFYFITFVRFMESLL